MRMSTRSSSAKVQKAAANGGGFNGIQSVQAFNAEIVKNREALKELGEAYVKFKSDYGPVMEEVKGFMSFMIEKAPAFKEAMAMMAEARGKFINVEVRMNDVKKRGIDLSNFQSVSTKENAEREIETEKLKLVKTETEVKVRESFLKIERDEFYFGEAKKLYKKNDEDREQRKKQRKSAPESEHVDGEAEAGEKKWRGRL